MKVKLNDIEMEDYQSQFLQKLDNLSPIKGKKILEIGSDLECKTALGMLTLGAKEVWAVNPRFDASFVSPDPRIHVIKSLGEKTKFKKQTFDIIFGIALLEHVLKPEKLFKECKRLLKEDGLCLLQGNPFWTSHWGHHIWSEKYKFNNETNPFSPWEHLCYKNYDELYNGLAPKGYSENEIKEIYNLVYLTTENSRIYPEEIKKIAKHIKDIDLKIEPTYSNIPQNKYYDIASKTISEEQLKTNGLTFIFTKKVRPSKTIADEAKKAKSLLSIYDENSHKVIRCLGIKVKFRLKRK